MVIQKYRTCKKCGIVGGYFITRKAKLASGREINYIDNKCCLCANEESRDRHYRLMKNPIWRENKLKKLRIYKQNNKEKIRKQAKTYWIKNREEIIKRRNLKKKDILKASNRFKKNSHHRIPSNKNLFRNFNFKSIHSM